MTDKEMSESLVDDLNTVISKYIEQGVSYVELVGCLELVKLDIYMEHRVVNSDNINWSL